MGIIRMGIPVDIAIFLKNKFEINRFVETGTYKGETSLWASDYFRFVDTVEFSEVIYKETKKKLERIKIINCIFGDSREVMKNIISNSTEPILFWLDAHWCSGDSYGEEEQCPLLDELKILNESPYDHFILIDDARLFMTAPPIPNNYKHYPTLEQICNLVQGKKYMMIYEDVILLLPLHTKPKFSEFMQSKTTQDWKEYGDNLRGLQTGALKTQLEKTKTLFGQLLRVWNLR